MQQSSSSPRRIGARELFIAFTGITLSSFGGALFWSRRAVVERHRWLTEHEFVETVALAQLLPGANGVNLAVLIGYRFDGTRGAFAALAGFLAAPFAVIMSLGLLHREFGELPAVHGALTGMSAVAVGLLLAMAARMVVVLPRRVLPWVFVMIAFVAVGVMRLPFVAVVGALAPFAIAASWKGKL